ncbi:hypothetical protein [Amycolatopsis sp. cmx-4-68]|uniref:hypothetical protein n=1 Tax=Amycolatopsis sp. cmx-4-68 TaxID=2790938 RepID=UPI00397B0B72
MRIRIALSLGALVLAGGALTGGIALASEAQAPAPASTTVQPTQPPRAVPTTSRPGRPTVAPAPRDTQAPVAAPRTGRVPRAVPAGPTGDLHLPAIGVTR